MAKRGPNFSKFVFNCDESRDKDTDWGFGDAADAKFVDTAKPVPASVDHRASWWKIRDQGKTGACVGFATADGVLRWHYVQKKMFKMGR